jgi:hypothetical protein
MKKLVLTGAIALAPLSFAFAGDAAEKKAAAPAAGKATVTEQPAWDTRQAGQGVDLKGGDKADKK